MEKQAKTESTLQIALKYQGLGFSIIPIKPMSKTPYIEWQKYQRQRAEERLIREWFTTWPDANCGIVTGAISGIVVLDADREEAQEFIKKNGMPPTPEVITGKGTQYYLKHPGKHILNKVNSEIGLDVRADGGYVVAPPSIHPNGKRYIWAPFLNPWETEISELIPWMLKYISTDKTQKGSPQLGWQDEILKGVNNGDRNNSASKLAGSLIAKGISPAVVLATLEGWNLRNKPPLPHKELETVVDSIAKTEARNHPPEKGSLQSESKSGPSMADLRAYMDMDIRPGQSFTSKNICDGLAAYRREDKKIVYAYLSRLAQEGIIKKDKYIHGGFRKPLEIPDYDLESAIQVNELFGVKLPLDLQNLLKIEPNQLVAISGRYDAGKSALLWHTVALNWEYHKIVHFSSPEWDADAIKRRMDELEIPRPHPNITCYPMEQGYEDLIPEEQCIVLVDYLRPVKDFSDIDRQFHRIFENLHGSVCFAAIQKHPGLDRPVGGQFGVHAPHHVIMLDKIKTAYICKIFKSKGERDLEGLYRVFKFEEGRRLVPYMKDWKKGEIRWEKPKEGLKSAEDSNDSE